MIITEHNGYKTVIDLRDILVAEYDATQNEDLDDGETATFDVEVTMRYGEDVEKTFEFKTEQEAFDFLDAIDKALSSSN